MKLIFDETIPVISKLPGFFLVYPYPHTAWRTTAAAVVFLLTDQH